MNRDDYQSLILDSLPHWAMLIDAETRTILAANRQAKELGSKINGQCWDDFAHRKALSEEAKHLIKINPDRKRDNCIKCSFCEADEAIEDNKTHIAYVDIDGIIWKTYWVPVEGNIYLHYALDVTEAKKIEQLKLEKEKLSAVVKTIGAVCHETAQPLMVVLGHLGLLEEDILDLKDNKHFQEAKSALNKLTSTINKLQRISQVKTKKYLDGEILDIEESSK